MNLLAIETATTACAIAVRVPGRDLVRVLDEERRHTESLAPGIAAALDELGLSVRELERVVVDRGPGLYTGLRVGLATADALSRATGCDLVGVTSLELLAHGAFAAGVRGELVSVVDARRGEVFIQRFFLDAAPREVDAMAVARPGDLAADLARGSVAVTLTGDGAARYRDLFDAIARVTFDETRVPSCAAALDLGAARDPLDAPTPIYLRDPDAVANFVTRERS
jgi:tRNA threonylcarbamoyladenosine biosynthesis protein TsaB